MTNLNIYVNDALTAVEVYCFDDVKYVESFSNWFDLLARLTQYMGEYASVSIRFETRKEFII